jgi:2-keto-myo-inositol isomerase
MHERFCLNTATIKGTPVDLQIDLGQRAGFRKIGLWLEDVEAAMGRGSSVAEIKARLDNAGLRVAELCFLGGWHDANETRLKDVIHQTRHICNISRALACEIVVTVPALEPGWLPGASNRFREVCQAAAEYGVRIALEFPGIAAEVKNLRSAWELVAAAACPNGGLTIDTFHFYLGGSKLEDFKSVLPEQIFLVHVSDAMKLPLEELRKPHDNRTYPGDGVIDFGPIWQQLNQLHYDGTISLEIWNRRLHQCDPGEVVRRGCESLSRIEDLLNHPGQP